ncbi:hypothetical protein STAL104432_17100 [Streptomyces albus]
MPADGLTGTVGGRNVSPATASAKSASIGSISGEWKAWLTRSRRVRRPRSRQWPATRSTASRAPETTTAPGPLTAARDTSASPWSSTDISASPAATATIAPPSGSASISRPRATTRRAASWSVSTPATTAAATSPTEWPATAANRTPHASHSRARATSKANNAGCAYSVRSSTSAGSCHITSVTERPSSGSTTAAHSSSARAN